MMRLLVLGLAFVGFVAATCPDNTVTSEEHCRDLCVAIHSTTDISFTVTHSTKECHCIVGELDIQVCTTTTTTTTTTASPTTSPYVPPTRAEIRAELVDLFGWPCIESINSAITDNYTDCSADFDTDDHTELESTAWDYFNDLCVDRCIPIFVNSVNILLESNCFRPNEQDLTNPLLFRLNLFKILEGKVTMGCALASTTGDYCGGVLTPLTSFVQNSSQIRRNHCEAVSDRGYCLGTILRAGEVRHLPLLHFFFFCQQVYVIL